MPDTIRPSVAQTEAILWPYGAEHRLTVVCGLIAPASGEIALVQTTASAGEEGQEWGLKLPQGDINEGEGLAAAYLRELGEEIGVPSDAIEEIQAVPLDPPMIGGRPRDGKPSKAYGIVYGITRSRPELQHRTDEIAIAEWHPNGYAEELFRTQWRHPDYRARGRNSFQALTGILAHFALTRPE